MIRVIYTSVDGFRDVRKYKAIAGARRYAHERIGEHPDQGRWYAVSFDGIGKIEVEGASLADLFPDEPAALPLFA